MGRSKNKFGLIIISALLIILSVALFKINSGCKTYNCISMPGKDSWKVSDIYENTDKLWRGYLKAHDYDIRLHTVKKIDKVEAEEYSKIAKMNILGLFDTAKSPYPGAVSDKVVCPEEFKPIQSIIKSKDGTEIEVLQSYLNNRMQYGSCSISQISYHVYSGIFYCANEKSWYQLEIISPAEAAKNASTYLDLFKEVSCKS
jgi:hypothetical protein